MDELSASRWWKSCWLFRSCAVSTSLGWIWKKSAKIIFSGLYLAQTQKFGVKFQSLGVNLTSHLSFWHLAFMCYLGSQLIQIWYSTAEHAAFITRGVNPMVCAFRAFPVNQNIIKGVIDKACLFRTSIKYLIICLVCFTFGVFTCMTNYGCSSLYTLGLGMFSLHIGALKYSIMKGYYGWKRKWLETCDKFVECNFNSYTFWNF